VAGVGFSQIKQGLDRLLICNPSVVSPHAQ